MSTPLTLAIFAIRQVYTRIVTPWIGRNSTAPVGIFPLCFTGNVIPLAGNGTNLGNELFDLGIFHIYNGPITTPPLMVVGIVAACTIL